MQLRRIHRRHCRSCGCWSRRSPRRQSRRCQRRRRRNWKNNYHPNCFLDNRPQSRPSCCRRCRRRRRRHQRCRRHHQRRQSWLIRCCCRRRRRRRRSGLDLRNCIYNSHQNCSQLDHNTPQSRCRCHCRPRLRRPCRCRRPGCCPREVGEGDDVGNVAKEGCNWWQWTNGAVGSARCVGWDW